MGDAVSDTRGRLVIIGGGLQAENTEVYRAILDGRDGDGPICAFPTASAEPQESMQSAVRRIDAVGGEGTAEGIFLSVDNPEDAALPEIVERIRACSGFYFSGGSQSRIARVFRPETGDSPAFEAVRERFEAGAVVSGSSAGAAIMNDPMIGGGNSLGSLDEGVRWGEEDGEGVLLVKGLGFLENTLVDQHFLARGRWARLLVAVLETDAYTFGAGIDENTALVVDGDSAWVAGASGVVFFDTRSAVRPGDGAEVAGVSLVLLGRGASINLSSGARYPEVSKEVVGQSEPADEVEDIDLFERWGLLRFLAASARSDQAEFSFTQDGHAFEFTKGPGYEALAGEGEGIEGAPQGLSVGPLILRFSGIGSG
jgi:cyanophycinase